MMGLGNFEFKYTGDFIQGIEALSEDEDDVDVPPAQSITVAVDSNRGLQYSCLYRFRVPGEEV